VRFHALLLVLLLASPAPQPDLLPGQEHLPLRAKPPAPGQLPASLRPHAERLGVPPASDADRMFDRLADRLLAHELESEPIAASGVGVFDYAALLPATDTLGIARALTSRAELRSRLAQIDSAALEPQRRFEHARLLARLDRQLDAERWWETDPVRSIAIVSHGLSTALRCDSPFDSCAWNAVARLTRIPEVLRDARTNLKDPARADVEMAISAARELVRYLSEDLPVQMAPARDPVLREEFDHHLASAAGAAADFHGWLGSILLPRATASSPPVRPALWKLDREIIESLLEPRGRP
jgi:hypothetical protein